MPSAAPCASPSRLFLIGLAGALALAAAQGFGRFSFTPILPGMMAGLSLTPADAGLIAAANFTGYLAGALASAYGWAAGRERPVALAALLANALLLAAMALAETLAPILAIRFLAGAASAFALVFTSGIVLRAAAGKPAVASLHFGGVGIGIALSSLTVMAVSRVAGGEGWRASWLAGAGFSFAVFVLAALVLPKPPGGERPAPEPPLEWRLPLALSAAAYCLFGFGYIITATFLVAIARESGAGQTVEFLAWLATGIAAAVSLFAWQPTIRRHGAAPVFALCMLLLAVGVLASVLLPARPAVVAGGVLLGGTFMVITSCGLQTGRRFAEASPRRAFAIMTAIFGVGQIVGPLAAGWAAEVSGSFAPGSFMAAAALLVGAGLLVPVIARRR